MTRLKLLTAATCVVVLWLSESPAFGQYYPNYGSYGRSYGPGRARLSPYLNLARGDVNVDPAINYFLGTVPERERRFQESLLNSRVTGVEQRERSAERYRDIEPIDDVLPAVPTAGFPYGRRQSRDYFREDHAGNLSRHGVRRSPPRR